MIFNWVGIALLSAFFSAIAAILEKKILFKEKALTMSLVLALFNLILSIPFFFFINYSLVSFPGLSVLFFKSALGAVAFLFVMIGIKNLDLSKALPLLVLTPGLVAIVAFFTLNESLNLIEIIGMVLLLVGSYILQLGGDRGLFAPLKNFVKTKGNYYIVGALIIFTVTSILDKALLKNYKVPLNAFFGFQHLFFAIIFLFIGMVYVKRLSGFKGSLKFSIWFIFLLSVVTLVYRYSHIYAISVAPVALVLSIKRISVFFAVLIGGKLFMEENLFVRIVATVIMIFGAILIIIN